MHLVRNNNVFVHEIKQRGTQLRIIPGEGPPTAPIDPPACTVNAGFMEHKFPFKNRIAIIVQQINYWKTVNYLWLHHCDSLLRDQGK